MPNYTGVDWCTHIYLANIFCSVSTQPSWIWDKFPKEYLENAYICTDSTSMSAYGVKGPVENVLAENGDTYDSHAEHIQESIPKKVSFLDILC